MSRMSDADIESELKDDLQPLMNRIRRPMRRSERTRKRNRRVRFQKTRHLRKILLSLIIIGVAIIVTGLIITTLRTQPKRNTKFPKSESIIATTSPGIINATSTTSVIKPTISAEPEDTTAVPEDITAVPEDITAVSRPKTAAPVATTKPPMITSAASIKTTPTATMATTKTPPSLPTQNSSSEVTQSSPKTILLWNRTNRTELFHTWKLPIMPIMPKHLLEHVYCKVSDCIVTDRLHKLPNQTLQSFDAIVFYDHPDLRMSNQSLFPNETRNPNTYYIYASIEPYSDSTRPIGDYYNATMTCRRDSDIVWRVFYITTKENPSYVQGNSKNVTWLPIKDTFNNETENYLEYYARLKKFTGLAAIYLDPPCNATKKRSILLAQMQDYMKIDILGKCSNNKYYKFMDEYKFYLAFEADFRQDCVTDFFYWAFFYKTVPVVFGGLDYKVLAPPHTYINARDFNSTKALTDYLLYLDANPDKYLEYLYNFERYKTQVAQNPICDLCKMLHKRPKQPKIIKDQQFVSWQRDTFEKLVMQPAVLLNKS